MTIPINKTERIVISRQGTNNAVQYQKNHPKEGWKTEIRKIFEGNWKGDLVEEMKNVYISEQRNKMYFDSKLRPYH